MGLDREGALSGPQETERCCADVVTANAWHTYRCTKKAKVTVKTDRGDYPLCGQHLAKFKRRGLWAKDAMTHGKGEYIKPEYVLLAEREALGV